MAKILLLSNIKKKVIIKDLPNFIINSKRRRFYGKYKGKLREMLWLSDMRNDL